MDRKERYVRRCEKLIRAGYSEKKLMGACPAGLFREVYEIARCRINMRDKFSVHNLYFDTYGLRYSTPEIIGKYRAERIKNKTIADISCGVGLQAIFFSFTNRDVLGVDISERRVEYARRNAKAYGAKNIRFVQGDCLSDEIYRLVKEYDVIFSDPARDEREEERKLETLRPSPLQIIEKYGNREYIFDLPPQMEQNHIPQSWEKEYISINGKITRLTAYTNKLKMHERIAVSLPSKSTFWTDEGHVKDVPVSEKIKLSDYIYLVDESLYYARLLGEFAEVHGIVYLTVGKRRTLATGSPAKTPFLKPYQVLCHGSTLAPVLECMKNNEIGKVTLRFSVPPEEYWQVRRQIEESLNGEKKATLFRIMGRWVAAKNVT